MQQESFLSTSLENTQKIAAQMAFFLRSGDVLLLRGDLGAGKSTFARALIQTLCGSTTEVPSPTFTLVQTYDAPSFLLWHFDLYRLEAPEEIYELGIEEAFQSSVSLIEWPEKAEGLLPQKALSVEFAYGTTETERILTFTGWAPEQPTA